MRQEKVIEEHQICRHMINDAGQNIEKQAQERKVLQNQYAVFSD